MATSILCMQNLLRLIEIDGVDISACGGTHLDCTSQLQVLKLVGLEKSRGQARLRFMAGGRVISALGSALMREAVLNKVGNRKVHACRKQRALSLAVSSGTHLC